MTNQDTTSIDEQINKIFDGLLSDDPIYISDTKGGWVRAKEGYRQQIKALISDQVAKAYRRGWRDHQRLAAERDVKDRLSQLRSKE